MLHPNTLQNYLRAQPFRPVRIVMNNGRHYEVRHPELIAVGRDVCVYYHRDLPDAPFEDFDIVSLMLMEHVEYLDQPAPAGPGNGQ